MFKIENSNGISAEIINLGATIVSINVPDKKGNCANVALGFDSPAEYSNNTAYFGSIVGRYGNRIAAGRFILEGREYKLPLNKDVNHLHGGPGGFHQLIWQEERISASKIKLSCFSPDGDQGYPGNLHLSVVYSITDENGIKIELEGITDKTTILNPTNHSYFNLSALKQETILDHEISIDADYFTVVDQHVIPTGEIRCVENTVMDFRKAKPIGKDINCDNEQIKVAGGFDHNWVLNNFNGSVRKAASVYDKISGRIMDVYTDQPGVQFYSGNFLAGLKGSNNRTYRSRAGLCLETQHFPDSPNNAHFPSTVLRPAEKYRHTTEYRFSGF